MVPYLQAQGGIICTASHNPKEWNALKLLNEKGEFISDKEGKDILEIAETEAVSFAEVDYLGKYEMFHDAVKIHTAKILALPEVKPEIIQAKKFKIVLDAVNSTGGLVLAPLFKALGCKIIELYCEPSGDFPHNPEPLKEHLGNICEKVVSEKADLGIVVDPDVDRLAFIDENGEMFGEEYTLVAVADYLLKENGGVAVSNLSSSRALRDVAERLGGSYYASAVGEVNVVEMMKEKNALIGGEGNGGIIFPKLHYGRDSLIGVALFLTHLAQKNVTVSDLRKTYPAYYMGKNKIQLDPKMDVDGLLEKMKEKYKSEDISTIDGVKIDFPTSWVHLRKSNTEPIIRIYTEAGTQKEADALGEKIIQDIKTIL